MAMRLPLLIVQLLLLTFTTSAFASMGSMSGQMCKMECVGCVNCIPAETADASTSCATCHISSFIQNIPCLKVSMSSIVDVVISDRNFSSCAYAPDPFPPKQLTHH
jgi:hypothetical protein